MSPANQLVDQLHPENRYGRPVSYHHWLGIGQSGHFAYGE